MKNVGKTYKKKKEKKREKRKQNMLGTCMGLRAVI
jgi:hypothetical protein